MNDFIDILESFGGGKGCEPTGTVVRFLLPLFFWLILGHIAGKKWRIEKDQKHMYIVFAAVAGCARELLMFIAEYGSYRGYFSFDAIYLFYPPFEHAATMLVGIFISFAFMRYSIKGERYQFKFIAVSTFVTLAIYIVTAIEWPIFLSSHPKISFGAFWGDLIFRIAASLILAFALVTFINDRKHGIKIVKFLIIGIGFLLLDELLMIVNIATNEHYVSFFAPIRHNLHIWSIPFFIATYYSELSFFRKQYQQELEIKNNRLEELNAILEANEKKYRLLIENNHDIIYTLSADGIFDFVSPTWTTLRGHPANEVIGKPFQLFVHQDDVPAFKDWLQKASETGQRQEGLEYRIQHADKTWHWYTSGIVPLKENSGKITGFEGSASDITERKKAEEALAESNQLNKQIIQSAHEGIIVYDRNLNFQLWNPFMENLVGIPASEVLGKNPENLFPFLKDIDATNTIEKALRGEIIPEVDVPFFIQSTGKSGWASDTTAPLFNSTGEIIGVIRTVRDITERKKTEQELIKAKEHAEESDRLKTAFLSNMSHEIRTPMTGISGFAQLIVKSDVSDENKKLYSEIITNSCVQLTNILSDIIDISKIETDQMELTKGSLSINDLIRETFNLLSINATKKGVSLQPYTTLKDNECLIYSDKHKLQQVLNNLVGNAIKFTREGHVRFGYDLVGSSIQFSVEDTGIGIAPEFQDKVFDRFRQVESGFSRSYDGAGLGLSISKSLVQLLGGQIWMESILGKGSTFYFSILNSASSENSNKSNDENIEPVKIPKNSTVLIAEDFEINFMFIEAVLSAEGLNLLHAWNGKEAVAFCATEENIDIVLMDIKMPIMNGYEAREQIKKIRPDLPIIVQTAFAIKGDEERILQSGFDGYLAKPILKKDLIETIQKFIPNKNKGKK